MFDGSADGSDAGEPCFPSWGRQVGGRQRRQHRWSFSRVGRSRVPDVPSPLPIDLDPRRRIIAASFGLLDEVCLKDEFNHRAHVLKVVPFVVRGAFRGAMWLAFEEILEGHEVNSNTWMSRGPRMLLHRPSNGGVSHGNSWRSDSADSKRESG